MPRFATNLFAEPDERDTAVIDRVRGRKVKTINDDIAEAHAAAEAAADPIDRAKAAELDLVKGELIAFIRVLGVGEEFQASDFTRRLHDRAVVLGHLDLRAIGGLILTLKAAGVVEPCGMRHTGAYGKSHSTPRAFYRITRIDFSELGWGPTPIRNRSDANALLNPPKRKKGTAA